MEIKKYVRHKNGELYKVEHNMKMLERGLEEVETANTPQELAQKDDIVEFELYEGFYLTRKVISVVNGVFFIDSGDFFNINDITKILTPHGKDYICQWEVE